MISDVLRKLGSWDVTLSAETPTALLDSLTFFGHVAVVPGRIPADQLDDGLLSLARYVGILRARYVGDHVKLSGVGMAAWLGDEDGKGPVLEAAVELSADTFADSIRSLLPAAVEEGTLHNVAGTYTSTHRYQTPREAIDYVADTFGADWRVNGDGTLDAGEPDDLFVTSPRAIIVRKGAGVDMDLRALPGQVEGEQDAKDFTTRVVLLAEGEGASIATGSADIALNPYVDIHGNPVDLTRLSSESETAAGNATQRAQLLLNRFSNPKRTVRLSTRDFDVEGDFRPGDYVYVYDPETGLVGDDEVPFRGRLLHPVAIRLLGVSFPVAEGNTVAYRGPDGVWTDLSPYVQWESGETALDVGDELATSLTNRPEPIGTRPVADSSVPATPVIAETATAAYQSPGSSETRAQVWLSWDQPLNADGSTIVDGARYDIRYRPNATVPYPATWTQASGYTWDEVHTWGQPLVPPITATDWQYISVPFDVTEALILELLPFVEYEFQIRAADTASPANQSAWSSTTTVTAAADTLAPVTPAAPEVAASRIAVQVLHRLGQAAGGTFNLDADLSHLEVHVGGDASFFPAEETRVGTLPANVGLMQAQIPVVGTFPIEPTGEVHVKVVAVDQTGNRSSGSESATGTAALIDDAHISDLTVSKVTAGTVQAEWLMAGEIKTSDSGARAQMDADGFHAYNTAGVETFRADSDGDVAIVGEIASGPEGQRIVINPSGQDQTTIRFYPAEGADYAALYAVDQTLAGSLESWVSLRSSINASDHSGAAFLMPGYGRIGCIDETTNGLDGGGMYFDDLQSLVGHFDGNNIDGGVWSTATLTEIGTRTAGGALKAGMSFSSAEDITITGQWFDNNSYSGGGTDAVVCGAIPQGAAALTFTRNYGINSAGTMRMVATWHSATNVAWRVSTVNNVGFVMTVASSSAGTVQYWGFRVEP